MLCEFTVTQPYFTNVPEDVIVNTFHWVWDGASPPTNTELNAVADELMAFYALIFSSGTTNGRAPWAPNSNWKVKAYDLAQAKPRVPIYSATKTATCAISAAPTTPPEVALCLSYQADYLPGVNPASMRGRVFIGGLGTAISAGGVAGFPTPTAQIISGMTAAGISLAAGITGYPDWSWVVYSQKLGVFWPVTKGWVDNALDTQRRRGQKASSRTVWAA